MTTNKLVKRSPSEIIDMGVYGMINMPVTGCYDLHVYSEKGKHLGKFIIVPKDGYKDMVYTDYCKFQGDHIVSYDL